MGGRLEGEVALVTGGGSGLGRAVVDRFVAEGARVVVLDRSLEKLERLSADHAGPVACVQGDVTSVQANEAAVSTALGRFGRLDCLVANAAIWDHGAHLLSVAPEALDRAFDELFGVNVKGYLLAARAAGPALVASEGSMILTLSNAAFYPGGGGPLYTASKHAGLGLMRELAFELAPRVRVNAVAPSGMATDLRGPVALGQQDVQITDTRTPEQMARNLPLQRFFDVADFAWPYVALASRAENRTLTGVVMNADCGLGVRGLGTPAGGLHL